MECLLQLIQGTGEKIKFVGHLGYHAFLHQQIQYLHHQRRWNIGESAVHLFQGRGRESGIDEQSAHLFPDFLLIGLQGNPVAGKTDNALLQGNASLFVQISQAELKEFLAEASFRPAAQLLLGQSGFQRAFQMVLGQDAGDFVKQYRIDIRRDAELFFRINHHHLAGRNGTIHQLLEAVAETAHLHGQFLAGKTVAAAFPQMKKDQLLLGGGVIDGKNSAVLLPEPFPFRSGIVEHHAAADGGDRRIAADHIMVARPDPHRLFQQQLHIGRPAGSNLLILQQDNASHDFSRTQVHADPGPVFQGLFVGGQEDELGIQHIGGLQTTGGGQDIAPLDHLHFHPLDVDGRPVAGLHQGNTLSVHLNAADLAVKLLRINPDIIAHRHPSGQRGAGYHRPEPLHGEDAVDGQSEGSVCLGKLTGGDQFVQSPARRVDSLAGGGGNHDQRGIGQKTVDKETPDLILDQFQPVGFHHILFGDDNESFFHSEQPADLKMLPGLRHDALVGGNDKGNQINTGNAGHHVFDKPLMAGHVDNAQPMAALQIKIGKTEFNGDPPLFFLLEPVGVDAGQGPDKAGFAVIHMTCCPQYDFPHA